MIPRSGAFIAFLVGLLAVNLLISFVTGGPEDRTRVPYQPFFVDQVTAGNVEEIGSQEDSIEGELKNGPPTTRRASQAGQGDKFKTEVPAFIDPPTSRRCSTQQRS